MKERTKAILLKLPCDLYDRFKSSKLRSESRSDQEGIRTAIRESIKFGTPCQANSGGGA